MPDYEKCEIEVFDEECEIEQAYRESWPDGTQVYTCQVHMMAFLKDGTELEGVGTVVLRLKSEGGA